MNPRREIAKQWLWPEFAASSQGWNAFLSCAICHRWQVFFQNFSTNMWLLCCLLLINNHALYRIRRLDANSAKVLGLLAENLFCFILYCSRQDADSLMVVASGQVEVLKSYFCNKHKFLQMSYLVIHSFIFPCCGLKTMQNADRDFVP